MKNVKSLKVQDTDALTETFASFCNQTNVLAFSQEP